MPAGNEMRVSDAEREAAAAELREHFASGRLDSDELDQRLSAVFAAKTRGDLAAQFADLPSGAGAGAGGGQPFGSQAYGSRARGSQAFGGGPFGAGPFGPGINGGPFAGGSFGPKRALGRLVVGGVLLWALLIVGILAIFGIGAPLPFGIVLLIAAFSLLRRLLFAIFGWGRGRGRSRGRGPRGRGRGRGRC